MSLTDDEKRTQRVDDHRDVDRLLKERALNGRDGAKRRRDHAPHRAISIPIRIFVSQT